jgi:hypothetical protein
MGWGFENRDLEKLIPDPQHWKQQKEFHIMLYKRATVNYKSADLSFETTEKGKNLSMSSTSDVVIMLWQ